MMNLLSAIKNVTNLILSRVESEENGSGLVETAIVLMFILSVTFGIIDVSRAVYTNSAVTAAAQEGVRAGIIDVTEIHTAIESKMLGLDMTKANVEVRNNGDVVEVAIVYDFEFVTPLANVLLDSVELDGKASMIASM